MKPFFNMGGIFISLVILGKRFAENCDYCTVMLKLSTFK